ncbi:MAG: alpha/beta fold hydrolase [Candidatus Dormibacteraeota bacterium]|nr:alpha/beta fold hydrolase [Candidatus Dormibacteraeota bacterium]
MSSVVVNGVRLRYIREGSGEPVLLLPGYLFGADSWRPQINALRDDFDVIAVDLRGQFGSETTADGYDLWNQARDIHEFIQALGLQSVHLVGLSQGGMIGLRLAVRYGLPVRSLVLMDTTAGAEDPELAARYEAMAQVAEEDGLEGVISAMPPIFLADDFIAEHGEEVDAWLERVRSADPMGFVHALRALNAREDISALLYEIGVPTLVIHESRTSPSPSTVRSSLPTRSKGRGSRSPAAVISPTSTARTGPAG